MTIVLRSISGPIALALWVIWLCLFVCTLEILTRAKIPIIKIGSAVASDVDLAVDEVSNLIDIVIHAGIYEPAN